MAPNSDASENHATSCSASRQEEERAKSCCSQTSPQRASVMPPSAPFCSVFGWQSVCEKNCCEHWVLSQDAHTANRCYSEKYKAQTCQKIEHFSSSPYHEPQASTRRPAAQKQFNPSPHGPRPGRPSLECQTGFWG